MKGVNNYAAAIIGDKNYRCDVRYGRSLLHHAPGGFGR